MPGSPVGSGPISEGSRIGEVLGSSFGNGLSRLPLTDLCGRGSLLAWQVNRPSQSNVLNTSWPWASRLSERSC